MVFAKQNLIRGRRMIGDEERETMNVTEQSLGSLSSK
jgi:hypothetical protein